MSKYLITTLLAVLIPAFWAFWRPDSPAFVPKDNLSEYGFFSGNLADLHPASGLIPYEVNSPLFTDYATKQRFIFLPPGMHMHYSDTAVLDLPVGTFLLKNIFYPADANEPAKGRRILETRVLFRSEGGWLAMPYVWNDAQTDALLTPGGSTTEVDWRDGKGKKRSFTFTIPSANQCKRCHTLNKKMAPLGLSARQLNIDHPMPDGTGAINQLRTWETRGLLKGLPAHMEKVPRLANWQNPAEPLEKRARAWLEGNCGYCHNPHGAASFTDLRLDIYATDPLALGVGKTPEIADSWAGQFRFDIAPGKPDESVMIHRIQSTAPGVMMPEHGRALVHEEGVQLIREWVASMK